MLSSIFSNILGQLYSDPESIFNYKSLICILLFWEIIKAFHADYFDPSWIGYS